MDILAYNRRAWDRQAEKGNRWTVPVGPDVIAAARRGDWQVVLTPTRPVPADWFPALAGLDVLCLASGGGQQGPVLAAAGAAVTVLDNSPAQLARDRLVADREGLEVRTVQGDMADLSAFPEGSFGLVFHPCSNCFVPDVRPVWQEAFRVLRPGGVLLAGFCNPALHVFDDALAEMYLPTKKCSAVPTKKCSAPDRRPVTLRAAFGSDNGRQECSPTCNSGPRSDDASAPAS